MENPNYRSKVYKLTIQGLVQGVGYRNFAQMEAVDNGVKGWVRNLPNGNVEIWAEGSEEQIAAYLSKLYKGPPGANVENIITENLVNFIGYDSFEIRQ